MKTTNQIIREFHSKFNIAYVKDKGWAFLSTEVESFLIQALTEQRGEVVKDLRDKILRLPDGFDYKDVDDLLSSLAIN
jgi:hypothetical protein